ncbi:MAG: hypothetical protein ACK5L5_05145 [Bacteroidales bacterium]
MKLAINNILLVTLVLLLMVSCNKVDPKGYKIYNDNKDEWYPDRTKVYMPLYKYADIHSEFMDTDTPSSLLIHQGRTIFLSDSSVAVLFKYIESGHNALIFDDSFSFADDYIKTYVSEESSSTDTSVFILTDEEASTCRIHNSWENTQFRIPKFDLRPDSSKILGYWKEDNNIHVNFICIPYGKGKIYLHLQKEILQNGKFLDPNNLPYINKVLSVIPNNKVYEFNTKYEYEGPKPENMALSFIMDNPPLRNAWYLILATVLIFAIFNARRKQRVVPISKTLPNRTAEFVDSVSKLYLLKPEENYELIAKKEVKYLLEFIRTKLFLNTSKLDDKFVAELSQKTGINSKEIESLTRSVRHIIKKADVSQSRLIILNEKIEKFYKKTSYYGRQ